MNASGNEVMTLAAKAARGAGAPAGQAAEFGRAALCHLIGERDIAALIAALDALPSGPILVLPLQLARWAEEALADDTPCLKQCVADDPLLASYVEAHPFMRIDPSRHITLTLSDPQPIPTASRVHVPATLVKHLTTLAAKILVPDTAASRLAGAGAGLTDND